MFYYVTYTHINTNTHTHTHSQTLAQSAGPAEYTE